MAVLAPLLVLCLCLALPAQAAPQDTAGQNALSVASGQKSQDVQPASAQQSAAQKEKAGRNKGPVQNEGSVYDRQPPVTEKEVLAFAELLPQFRHWARQTGERPHPVVRKGRPDFVYSEQAAQWATARQWEARRFFCVMGRLAAGLAQVMREGSKTALPPDMPRLSKEELALVERHLGLLLKAGGNGPETAPLPDPEVRKQKR